MCNRGIPAFDDDNVMSLSIFCARSMNEAAVSVIAKPYGVSGDAFIAK